MAAARADDLDEQEQEPPSMKSLPAIGVAILAAASIAAPPAGVMSRLPRGYEVLGSAHVTAGRPVRSFEIVALGRSDEAHSAKSRTAPSRPLMIFEQRGGAFVPVARNDQIVMKADEGGQCDPFLDGEGTIAVKGRYFTVQNGVACGAHWTDYVTFRFDAAAGGFVFDNERQEDWELNPSNAADAEALVRVGPPRVLRDPAGRTTRFTAWRPKH